MTNTRTAPEHGAALRMLEHILHRYESVEAFLLAVRRELDEPTVILPPLRLTQPGDAHPAGPAAPTSGRHARIEF